MHDENQIALDLTMPLLTPEEQQVWCVVKQRRGRETAITGRAISDRTGLTYKTVQEVISHLAGDHGFFIASCIEGYFIPVTPEEHEKANKSLRHRAMVILHRVAKQEKRSIEEVFGQSRMEYEGAG